MNDTTRYKAIIAYDGTAFSGFQIQMNGRTVQEELEKALKKIHKGIQIKVTGSGRTDAGVHSRGQVIHYDSWLRIPPMNWIKALNTVLPSDVAVLKVEKAAEDFHARYDVKGKTYKYVIYTSPVRDPIKRHYAAHYPYKINISDMKAAAKYLVGTHDYTSFCSTKTKITNKVRTISKIHIEQDEEQVTFSFTGNGFLYNMVRILVGTLLKVGTGKITPESMTDIIQKRDREWAGKTAPSEGLYLWEVYY
ncbi:tRNA pseudouridine(38-40) synthase TruA [Bacillus niameyensis]|uniref:tRNA pseudouridine(38-40) synthase TruA n=1 Tax=Bacillus niameyensis TaxID=1522308 RepID=UPI000782AFD0|nr:tRNA pseudouridine(38-40) synthase TruA [Bacillus niameyensis]